MTRPSPPAPSFTADFLLSLPYLLCLLVGFPANLCALIYFLHKKKHDLPNYLYICSSLNDMLTNLLVFPVVASLWSHREDILHGYPALCTLFGMLLKMQASFSVFLVAVLSITRTMILIRPFLDISTRTVMWVVAGYGIYLVLNQVVPLALNKTHFVYTAEEVYCWDDGATEFWTKLDTWLDLLSQAIPVIPITISCVLSCVFVRRKGKCLSGTGSSVSNPRRATGTIILMTAVYILFNVPLCVNYVFWTIIENSKKWDYPDPFYNSQFAFWYLWNFTDCLFINLNSLLNPLIYFMRIKTFREWVCNHALILKGKIASKLVFR